MGYEHDHGEGHGGHGHGGGDEHGHDGTEQEFPLYSRPVQRQRWGEEQPHPHTNWGDTFFDLFYVAAAYNLGTLIRSEISLRGLLYFAGCFFPILVIWQQKMFYDSRYYTLDDSFHRGWELCILVALATAVLHIRPVNILSDPTSNQDMMIFSLSVGIAHLFSIGRAVEVYFNVIGEKAAKTGSIRELVWFASPLFFYGSSAILSGIKYYGSSSSYDDGDYHGSSDSSAYGYSGEDDHSYNETTSPYYHSNSSSYGDNNSTDDDHHRFLAGAATTTSSYGSSVEEYDLPVLLCLLGALSLIVAGILMVTVFLPGGGRHKEVMIPMNINFCIHRYGEWTMLMLGESVLSLLIVDVVEGAEYYKTLISGVISITLLEYLHFRSQPHNPDDHAMRRKKEAGIAFSYTMWAYSAALIVLGTSYKMLLYEYVYEEKANKAAKESSSASDAGDYASDNGSGYDDADDSHRRGRMLFGDLGRALAGADDAVVGYDPDRRQAIAHFFCGSMAIVWFCSDLMIIIHRGLHDNLGRCRFDGEPARKKLLGVGLVLVRVGLIAFIATLSQYVTEPDFLAFVGLMGILTQVALRYVGSIIFNEHDDDEDLILPDELMGHFERSDASFQPKKWPNVTEGQAVSSEFRSAELHMEKIEE